TELALSLARAIEAAPGEPVTRRVEVAATGPVHAVAFGDHVTLDQLDLATSGGDLRVRGSLDGTRLSGALDGHLDLELLQPFLVGTVDKLSGALEVSVTAGGSLAVPDLRGRLAVQQPIRLRPKSF